MVISSNVRFDRAIKILLFIEEFSYENQRERGQYITLNIYIYRKFMSYADTHKGCCNAPLLVTNSWLALTGTVLVKIVSSTALVLKN